MGMHDNERKIIYDMGANLLLYRDTERFYSFLFKSHGWLFEMRSGIAGLGYCFEVGKGGDMKWEYGL